MRPRISHRQHTRREDVHNILAGEVRGPIKDNSMILLNDGFRGSHGTAELYLWDKHNAELSMIVNPEHQRSGVGLYLLKEAEKRARELGCKKVYSKTHRTNAPAIGLLEKAGWSFKAMDGEKKVYEKELR